MAINQYGLLTQDEQQQGGPTVLPGLAQQMQPQATPVESGGGMFDGLANMSPQAMAAMMAGLSMIGSNKRIGPALAQAAPTALATMNMQSKLLSEKEEKEEKEKRRQGLSRFLTSDAFLNSSGINAGSLDQFRQLASSDPEGAWSIYNQIKTSGAGTYLSDEQKKALGYKPREDGSYPPVWVDPKTQKPTIMEKGPLVSNTTNLGDGSKGWGKNVMERYNQLQSTGDAGASLSAQSQQLRSLLESGVATGANEQWKMNVKRVLGVDLGQVAGQEAVTALSNEMILPQVKQLGVNPTDRDLSFVVAGSPSLTKTKEGNLLMLDALDLKSARNQLIAEEAANFVEKAKAEGMSGIDARLGLDRMLRDLMKTHPLWTNAPKQLQERMSKVIAQPPAATTDSGPPPGVKQWEWDAMSDEEKALWR